ncbi:MAG: DUF6092 family protein [Actinomycetia bacterium]|nr:DUF6092 family protein [Actinomycetes bacterium]
MSHTPAEDRLFEIVLYLVSCARLTIDEPPIYGSLRLVESASRLVTAAAEIEGLDVDDFLREGRGSIEREKLRMIEDAEGYTSWLTGLLTEFAAEAARRNLGESAAEPLSPPSDSPD